MKAVARVGTLIVLCAALTVALAGCGSKPAGPARTGVSGSNGPAKIVVVEQDYEFTPSDIKAKVGDMIEFTNKDSVAHRVSVKGEDLGQQNPGTSKTWKAAKAGTYPFVCAIHPDMAGTITVQ